MKAMLSDRAARGWMYYQGDEGAQEAVLEAQAILAVSEQEVTCEYCEYDEFPRSGSRFWPVRAIRRSEHASALAESLASFLEGSL